MVNAISKLRNKMSLAKQKICGIYKKKRSFVNFQFSLYFLSSKVCRNIHVEYIYKETFTYIHLRATYTYILGRTKDM